MAKILLTGGSGFVGRHLIELYKKKYDIKDIKTTTRRHSYLGIQESIVPDYFNHNWKSELNEVETVVHLAALAHSRKYTDEQINAVNVDLPVQLIKESIKANVRHFVFISTIKVYGDGGESGYQSDSSPAPSDIYGFSKYKAELRLQDIAKEADIKLTIIRVPLVYGENVTANFLSLLTVCNLPQFIPFPLAQIHNRRSLIYVKNLSDLILHLVFNPPKNQCSLIHANDGCHVSTSKLINDLNKHLKKHRFVFSLPRICIKLIPNQIKTRLWNSLYFKEESSFNELNWKPPFTYQQALAQTVDWFRSSNGINHFSLQKRALDISVCLLFSVPIVLLNIFVGLLVLIFDGKPMIYWSERVGRNNQIFLMPKFRTMKNGTPKIATHLLNEKSENYVTRLGAILRKLSLDELPQFWSVFKGDMTLVGPRPALYNQYDLVELRSASGIPQLVPGVTGWAQVNGRDSISISDKVKFEEEYMNHFSMKMDLKIIAKTFLKVLSDKDVSH